MSQTEATLGIMTTRARTDRRITISMDTDDYELLLRLQQRIRAYSASETIRYALRLADRETEAAEAAAKKSKPKR